MEERIRNAFDGVRASGSLKARTAAIVMEKAQPQRRRVPRLRLAAFVLAAAMALGGLGALAYFTPTGAISVASGPQVELKVNLFGLVISASGTNEAGSQLLQQVELAGMEYADAVTLLVENAEGEPAEVTVIADSAKRQEQLLAGVAGCGNAVCHAADTESYQAALSCGLTMGKYTAYQEILALDYDMEPQEAAAMSMRQLRDLIAQLSGETPQEETPGGQGYGQGGQGYGQGGQGNGPNGQGYHGGRN